MIIPCCTLYLICFVRRSGGEVNLMSKQEGHAVGGYLITSEATAATRLRLCSRAKERTGKRRTRTNRNEYGDRLMLCILLERYYAGYCQVIDILLIG